MVAMRRPKRPPAGPAAVFREVKQQVAGVAVDIKDGVRGATDELKSQAAELTRAVTESVKEQAEQVFDRQRDRTARRVSKLGRVVHQAAHGLHAVRMDAVADYVDSAGGQFERAADYIQDRDFGEVLEDAGALVERNRPVVVTGLFIAAFLAGRFLKATAERAAEDDASDEDKSGEDARGERPETGDERRGPRARSAEPRRHR